MDEQVLKMKAAAEVMAQLGTEGLTTDSINELVVGNVIDYQTGMEALDAINGDVVGMESAEFNSKGIKKGMGIMVMDHRAINAAVNLMDTDSANGVRAKMQELNDVFDKAMKTVRPAVKEGLMQITNLMGTRKDIKPFMDALQNEEKIIKL